MTSTDTVQNSSNKQCNAHYTIIKNFQIEYIDFHLNSFAIFYK